MHSDRRDPWKDLRPPDQSRVLSARRIDANLKWDLFWAVDIEGNCILLLLHSKGVSPPRPMPTLRGVRVEFTERIGEAQDQLVLRLVDGAQRTIFERLCLDIIHATEEAETSQEVVSRFVWRTWRWHRLLREGKDGRLTKEEQKGLIGEMSVLERYLLDVLVPQVAVNAWTGPLGSSRDFELARVAIESKAGTGRSLTNVSISSENQLETRDGEILLLCVSEVRPASPDSDDAFTITDLARRIVSQISVDGPIVLGLLEARLAASGFDFDDDYSDHIWYVGGTSVFEVRDGFPCLTASSLPSGVSKLRYSLDLAYCQDFRVEEADLRKVIGS